METRGAFRGQSPSTGGPVHVPARRRLGFTEDAALKDALNGGPRQAAGAALPVWAKETLAPEVLSALVGVLREALVAGRVGCWPGVGEFSVVDIAGRRLAQFREYPSVRSRLNA